MKNLYICLSVTVASLGIMTALHCHSMDKKSPLIAEADLPGENHINNSSSSDVRSKDDLPPNWPWRGVNIESKETDASDIDYLASIKVNFVRIQIKPPKRAERDNMDPVRAFYKEVEWAEGILNECQKHNMTSVLAFNFLVLDPKLKIDDKSPEFWDNKIYRDTVFKMVEIISERFKNRGNELAAYEVIGEPAERVNGEARVPSGISDFYQSVMNAVRKHDAKRWVVLSPGPWGKPSNYENFNGYNISDSHIIYGAHMYLPDEFTHQGVKKREKGSVSYPGMINNRQWNIELIRKSFNNMREFEKRKNALIYIGEFQSVRWAKGGDQWVEDVANTIDSYGWGWSYFSYEAGQDFWNPFFVVSNPDDDPSNWKIKNIGKEAPIWQYMITNFYSKNKQTDSAVPKSKD